MKFRRSARTGAILLAALGVAASFVPPAEAEGTKEIVFQGTANVTTGLGLPGANATITPNVNPSKKAPLFTTNGNTRSGSFTSATCAAVSAMPKQEKPTSAQGLSTCTIMSPLFTVTGYCGLSYGRGTGTLVVRNPVDNTIQQIIGFKFTWTDPGGGNLAILGNWWFGGGPEPTNPTDIDGDIVAAIKATPDPTVSGTSCTNKTQQFFLIEGAATLTHPKCLPGHNTGTPCGLP
jgi:hypothetical protein